jgi:D-glycero-D-manno-heptose 1,7-bisphosphate phosphatase
MPPAVFLDRDGTMIRDVGYLSRISDLEWFAWTADAVRLLNRSGLLVFVTTNQSGIARGILTEAFTRDLHAHMARELEAAGARVDGWFYCPHWPERLDSSRPEGCDCRKPRAGMVRDAASRFDLDLARSFVVGDRASDMGLAAAVGATGVLVVTGVGHETLTAHGGAVPGAAHVAADLMAATAWLLGRAGHPRNPL